MSEAEQRPAKVIFVLPLGRVIGGVETWSLSACRQLQRRGLETVLLEFPTAGPVQFEFTDVPAVRLPAPQSGSVAVAEATRRQLPAVLVPNGSAPAFSACARLTRKRPEQLRLLGMCHTDDAHYYNLLWYYEPIVHRFIAVSEECQHKLLEILPAHRANDVILRPYGVRMRPGPDREYSTPDQPLRLLYAGRLEHRQKRVFDLVYLARRLSELKVDYRLEIVGDGEARQDLDVMLTESEEDVRRRVVLRGPVPPDQMPQILLGSDACVLVSAFEGTSIFMLEGMGHGCVPVVTRVSGTGRIIRDGINGYSIQVGDIDAMAAAIAGLAEDRHRLLEMGHSAWASVRQYSEASYFDWFEQLVGQLWQEPARRWTPVLQLLNRLRPGQYGQAVPRLMWWLRSIGPRVPGGPWIWRRTRRWIEPLLPKR